MLGIFGAKFEYSVYGGKVKLRGSVTHTLIGLHGLLLFLNVFDPPFFNCFQYRFN